MGASADYFDVYKYSGASFFHHQTIFDNYSAHSNYVSWNRVKLTEDHKYLTVGGGYDFFFYVHQSNETDDTFELVAERNTSSYAGFTTLRDDQKMLVVSNRENILVYGVEDNFLTLEQN